MTKKLLKQIVGIDVAAKKLDVSLGRMDEQAATDIYAYKTFDNNEKGFVLLEQWVEKNTVSAAALRFVMEATGVYHEAVAYYLSDRSYGVSIVMPNKMANFFKTLEIKTVTDKSMSAAIAMFGLEKTLDNWQPPKKAYKELRQLTRERDQLIEEQTVIKNQLHAEKAEAYPNANTIERIGKRLKMLKEQILEIKGEIAVIVKKNAEVRAAAKQLETIPGIGLLTAVTILAETDGFSLIRNKRQLTSYAGLDVREKESGTSVKGKPKISKRGNRYLRKAMHLPALTAIRHNKRYKSVFMRIVARTGIKMKGVVAVQRKLLEMAYTIYKTDKSYDTDYLEKQPETGQQLKNKEMAIEN